MNLPSEAIKEFQDIYEKEVGEKISFDEAKMKAENFLQLFKIIYKPLNTNLTNKK